MKIRLGGSIFLSLVVLIGFAPRSDGGMATRRWGNPPSARAVRGPRAPAPVGYAPEAATAPDLDGKVNDACWADAPVMELARTLDGGGRAAHPTQVKAVRHGGVLYLAFRCAEPSPEKIRASKRGHDGAFWNDDSVEVFLGFGSTYYQFGVNAAGSTYDGRGKDAAWNSGFRVATSREKGAWTVELSIPLEPMVGKNRVVPEEWIANLNRNRYTGGSWQEFAWSPTFSGDSHKPERFGKLLFKSPPAKEQGPVVKGSVRIVPVGDGQYTIHFALPELSKGTRIHRADLLVFRTARLTGADDAAAVDIKIYPAPPDVLKGAPPKARGAPLKLRAPWFDRFDATEVVRGHVAAGKKPCFFVAACPSIDAPATCLDIAYGGKPGKTPEQVTRVHAFHHAGQTFITWREIEDLVGADTIQWGQFRQILAGLDRVRRVRYCVYRHTERITPENLHEAEQVAEVAPLSCWNVNGRNVDKPIDDALASQYVLDWHQWNPFRSAHVDGDYGTRCVMERLVIRDGAPPLPRGTGLYVHTVGARERQNPAAAKTVGAYYAVVTSVDGIQNTQEILESNSLAKPVQETPGLGEPVLQKKFPPKPYFNYREKRLHYVRWVAPPFGNLPSQYYNWGVGVPAKHGESMPVELSLHRDGRSFYRTQYRIEQDSLVLSPHDFPLKTWWYGYHESIGTLKSFRQGVVHNYTERRLLAFIDWAARKWPIDRSRILVTGAGGGAAGSGALHLGIRHHRIFNLVLSGYGFADYAGEIEARRAVKRARSMPAEMAAIWGKVAWDLRTDTGRSVWAELNLTRLVRELPRNTSLPLVTVTGHGMLRPMRDFFAAMIEKGHPFMARYGVYGGGLLLPVSRTGTWSRMIRLDIRKDLSLPAFRGPGSAALWQQSREPSGELVVSDGIKRWWGEIGTGCLWRSDDIVDQPSRYEITLYWAGRSSVRNPSADVTLRRIQKLRIRADWEYDYEIRNRAGERIREGHVKPGESRVFTVPAVPLSREGVRLILTP